MKTVFKSKVDFWLAALVYGVLLILVVALILEFDVVVFGIMVLTVAFVSGVLFGIRYVLENETLTVSVCGIRHGRYDLKKMTSVKKTRTLISSPASSPDRLQLNFEKRKYVVISPEDSEKFISILRKINPDADINLN